MELNQTFEVNNVSIGLLVSGIKPRFIGKRDTQKLSEKEKNEKSSKKLCCSIIQKIDTTPNTSYSIENHFKTLNLNILNKCESDFFSKSIPRTIELSKIANVVDSFQKKINITKESVRLVENCFNVRRMFEFIYGYEQNATLNESYDKLIETSCYNTIKSLRKNFNDPESKKVSENVFLNFQILQSNLVYSNKSSKFRYLLLVKNKESTQFKYEYKNVACEYQGNRIYRMIISKKFNKEGNVLDISNKFISLQSLFHPNILMYFETLETKKHYYQISPMYHYKLNQILNRGRISLYNMKRLYSLQFLFAIEYLHKCGLANGNENFEFMKTQLQLNYNGYLIMDNVAHLKHFRYTGKQL